MVAVVKLIILLISLVGLYVEHLTAGETLSGSSKRYSVEASILVIELPYSKSKKSTIVI